MHITGHSRRSRAFSFRHYLLIPLLLVQAAFIPLCKAMADPDEIWLLVDTSRLKLTVMRGDAPLREYENIAIGSNGPTLAKKVSDETTPLGEFRISRINPRSRFHLFMGLDYPTMEDAKRALADGRLSPEEYTAVSNAWLAQEPPPQNTRLGGYLGIHGLGVGNEEIHGRFNWTDGCIAVTNEQIDELAHWVVVGTRVSVR
ncbi:MAG: L,D-transpeptidase [Gammaproteobacteria bacterium]|nr:L,D-transpeptidase [Gammaproteobacteria bacterium]